MGNSRKKGTGLLVAFALVLGFVAQSVTITAQAANLEKNFPDITIGIQGNSTPTIVGFGGKRWVVIGYDGTGINSEAGTMTLLLAHGDDYGVSEYDNVWPLSADRGNKYSVSLLRDGMNNAANSIADIREKNLILSRTLDGGSGNYSNPNITNYDDDKVAGNTVTDALFWPLSENEAKQLDESVLKFTTPGNNDWWLRSPGSDYSSSAYVMGRFGKVTQPNGQGNVPYTLSIRPALKIDLTNVISCFTTSATDDMKLMALDPNTSNVSLTIADTSQRTATQGTSITVDYTDAKTATNKHVACVIEDSSGSVTYYAKLATAKNGTATIDLPADMPAGNYKLKMFNEQDNGSKNTNFVSTPVEIDLRVDMHQITATAGRNGNIQPSGVVSVASGASQLFTITPDSGYQIKEVKVDGNSVGAVSTYNFTNVMANATIEAEFEMIPTNTYLVTVLNGTGSGSYEQGDTVAITANPPQQGTEFEHWISNEVIFTDENSASTTFVMPANTVTVIAKYKNSGTIIPPTTKHAITLGASGDGTVSGGGSIDEGTIVAVTATPNSGNHFVNWTENDVVVSTDANYSFAVTAPRHLVAHFAVDSGIIPPTDPPVVPPVTPPTPNYTSGRSSSSSGGSSEVDVALVVGRALTKPEATKLFDAALKNKPEGATTLSIKARNYTKVDKTVLAELATLAEKNGVTLTVYFDTVVGKAVTYRLSVNPAIVQTNLNLTAKLVGGKITMPKFTTPVEIAVKLPTGITIENLKVIQNGKDITKSATPWTDINGYVHITTTGGELLLTK